MSSVTSPPITPASWSLYTALAPQHGTASAQLLREVVIVLAGTLLIALSARVQIPMWPVPMTMQTFAVLLIAMSVGGRLAAATLGLYLFQGAIGLPVFATGGGIAYFVSPTAGFLLGFLVAASVVGWMVDRGRARGLIGAFTTALAGCAIIYAFGAGYLAIQLGLWAAIQVAVLPFVLSDLLKSALVAVLLASAHGVFARKG